MIKIINDLNIKNSENSNKLYDMNETKNKSNITLIRRLTNFKNENKVSLCANHKWDLSHDNRLKINKSPKSWHEIDWKKGWKKIKIIQEEITIAAQKKNYKQVYKWQWILLNSFSGRALAVRKVVQNSGGKTPGTDGIIWNNTNDYMNTIKDLRKIIKNPKIYRAEPLKRVYIPKGNKGETRGLGIPTLRDRAMQALYHLAVDPVVESESDPNSYGFRKNRSTHDAIITLRSLLDKKVHSHWILKVDIYKCFDKINHKFLMEHTKICHKNVLEEWLKSGIMEEMNYKNTEEGTPQGGIISPMLCNIALNGLEKLIKSIIPKRKGIGGGVHVIRYADDIIILGKSKDILLTIKKGLNEFLNERGLKLNDKKTSIIHIKTGFDFLGFNIRRMKYNPKFNKQTTQETVLVIKPSKKGVQRLKDNIRSIIDKNKPIEALIRDLNPILRGWGEHKRISYHSQEIFISLDHWIYTIMMKWITKHSGSKLKAISRYVIKTFTRKWNWGISSKQKIINLGEIPIIAPKPLKLSRNPYILEDEEYFTKRRENNIYAKFRAAIYKKYKHLCPICGESLHNGEKVELHHVIPRKNGGKYSMENIQPLHQICHQKVTYKEREISNNRNLKFPLKKRTQR